MKKKLSALISTILALSLMFSSITVLGAIEYKYTAYVTGVYHQTEARSMLDLINEFRIENGVKPLTYSYIIEKDALQRAAEGSVLYSHTRPNGRNFEVPENDGITASAENLGAETANLPNPMQDVFNRWKQSEGHRKNMLNPDYHSVAIACFEVGKMRDECWVQEFSINNGEGYIDYPNTYTEPCDEKKTVSFEIISSNIINITFTPSIDSIELNRSETCELPTVATNKRYFFEYKWTIADESIARIEDNKVVGISTGSTVMTTTFLKGSQKQTVTIPITVNCDHRNGSLTGGYSPTCTESGLTDSGICSMCGQTVIAKEIPPLDHQEQTVKENEKSATCTTNGSYDSVVYCTVCKKELSRTKITTTTKLNHDYKVTKNAIPATCTANGSTEQKTCQRCNAVTGGTIVKATGHKYDTGKITKKPTCDQNGTKVYTCTVCKATKNETVEATGHAYKCVETKEATCTEHGYKYYVCTHCGDSYHEVLYGVHTMKTVTKAPTCTQNGYKVTECTVCHLALNKKQIINKTGHKYDTGRVTTKATCGKAGTKTYTCTVCKATKKETIKATGKHTYDNRKVTKAPTSSKTGVMTYTCKTCGAKKTSSISKLAKASISKLTAKSKGFTATWKRISSATGYQIQYSKSSKFTNAKTVTITKNRTVSKSVTKLTAKKRYYVRIRTYRTINGKKYYSDWSTRKYVTTK